MTLKFNRQAAMGHYTGVVAGGIDKSLDVIAGAAAKRAPSRKDTAKKPTKREEAVKVIRDNYIPDSARFTVSQGPFKGQQGNFPVSSVPKFQRDILSGFTRKQAADRARTNRGVGQFTFKFVGARSGEETGNIGYDPARGKVTAKATVRGGNLKSKIRRTQVEIDGNRVSGSVISGAPYSKFVEFGFTHVGGKQVAARPFMRKAIHEDYKPGWKSHFKDGR